MGTRNITVTVFLLSVLLCWSQGLNPRGRNVCESGSEGGLQCCSGWTQLGKECLTPLCEGNFTCNENELCVRPNECRCRHGYFGATCDMKCPSQYWGPDCKGKCTCHPNGQCDDVTGTCTCKPNRWGSNCEHPCGCQKGSCHQDTGVCTCYQGFWGDTCSNKCYCSSHSHCDPNTGQCQCYLGWYGQLCNAQCSCNRSPCEQLTGRCQCRERLWGTHCENMCQCVHGRCNQADGSCTCRPGFRGKFCKEPCPAGFYGQNCRNRCGHCKGQQPCKVTEGRCVTCERGWNGTRCDQLCAPGFFGENCHDICPPCKDGHFCNRIDGKCPHCNLGFMGDRCEFKCPNGTYGENCANECKLCFNGTCHFATGECLCDSGFHGAHCNISCAPGQYGIDCAQTCSCHDNNCHPVSGACNLQPNQRMGVMAAGVLVSSLLLLLLSLLCCCCLCRQKNSDDPENKTKRQTKRQLCGGFTRISSKLPRIPLRRQKLPKVVVSHHDHENTFNCSFIEPPSALEQPSPSWSSRGSFSSEETAEDSPVYSVPQDESGEDNRRKEDRNNTTETTILVDDEDVDGVSEVETLPEDTRVTEQASAANSSEPPCQPFPCQPFSESEGSCSGSESASVALKGPAPQPPQQINKPNDNKGGRSKPKENRKCASSERVKPRPPDPSTKPKVSWIHGATGANPNQLSQEETIVEERSRSGKKSSKNRTVSPEEATCIDEASASGETKTQRNSSGLVQLDHINGAVQSVFRKMSGFRVSKKTPDPTESPPKSPSSSNNREVIQPHINPEAASLLAAQLKEKTQSLSRSEDKTSEESSLSQGQRKKPTPPQKTSASCHLGAGKALLPTSTSSGLQRSASESPSKEAKTLEKQDSERPEKGDLVVKKTPIKKPPRKKGKDGNSDLKTKTEPKVAVMPPQIVN
ncbi:scavenger receptor class F member 2-like [Osmerus eperlanus]|uniref:scavenger receptor class F member 2-like n=1 Tax=Osmerus eperlanus TaxID=29151 RepID=UPI002E1602E0